MNMKKFHSILLAALLILTAIPAMAHQLGSLPVKTVDGKRYYYYVVQPKETVYSLAKRFGITQADLLHYNPSVAADGLKIEQELLFPVTGKYSTPSTTATMPSRQTQQGKAAPALHEYLVGRGETAYSVSRKFQMDLNDFYALNPSARDGLKAGQYVKVTSGSQPSAPAAQPSAFSSQPSAQTQTGTAQVRQPQWRGEADAKNSQAYVVQPADTYYSIARRYGLTAAELQAANPQMRVLREGATIVIPSAAKPQAENPQAQQPAVAQTDEDFSARPQSEILLPDTLTIAVALPFMAADQTRSRASQNATEFYKGLLLAVDSLATNSARPVKVLTFDTRGTFEGARAVGNNPALRSANVIIGPDRADQLALFADFARKNSIYLLNLYVIKDESYRTNPWMMHANIPTDAMYRKAAAYFLRNFPQSTIVILRRNDGLRDKEEFTNLLAKQGRQEGREVLEIQYNDKLPVEQLHDVLGSRPDVAFIPMSSKSDELSRLLPAVDEFKQQTAATTTVSLWGYPEWIVIRNEMLDKMHAIDTYIFSRFYAVESDPDVDQVNSSFIRWYGHEMTQQLPMQGLYGFDTAHFLLRALNANGGNFARTVAPFDGIQNAFKFERIPAVGGGLINDELFILNYTPSKIVYKQGL